MREGESWPGIPSTGDVYVGVFDTMRYGTGEVATNSNAAAAPAALQAPAVEAPLNVDLE